MEATATTIDGVYLIRPTIHRDTRGYFFESYSKADFDNAVVHIDFVQDNESLSCRGVVRGLHFQRPPYAQAKLVRCVLGAVADIVVDIRQHSATYGQHIMVELSAENKLQLYLPEGMAHGFVVLSDTAVFQYKCDRFYHPEAEGGLQLLDPALGIELPLAEQDMIRSDRDRQLPLLRDFTTPFTT